MPGRNGMGPMGQGPKTGGGRGWCGDATQRMEIPTRGLSFGMGWGNGHGGGWRHRRRFHASIRTGGQRAQMGWRGMAAGFPTALSKEQELAMLKQQAQSLEQTLGELKSRIQEFDKPAPVATEKEHE